MSDLTIVVPSPVGGERKYLTYSSAWWRRLVFTREFAIIVAVIIVAVVASMSIRNFASPLTLSYLLLDVTPILLIALPMALILISGEIDLSVASTVGLSNVVLGIFYSSGWPIEVAMISALFAGLVIGAVNGFLVTVVGLPSLAVTIGTLALFRGISVGLLGTTSITNFPQFWTSLAVSNFGNSGIPVVMIVVAIFAIVFAVLLHYTSFGRGIYVIGHSKEVANFSGVKVEKTKFALFLLSGFVAALAGVYYTFRYGSARGDNAEGLELIVVAAVLLGGVSIFGGRGLIVGVIAGVLLIGLLQSAMRFANVTADVINIVIGALLVASVVASSFLAWLREILSSWHRESPEKAGPRAKGRPFNITTKLETREEPAS
jgi:rhamnose transport system permease protein